MFLELGVKSMVSYLAFDNRSIKSLLGCKNEAYFDSKFPLFFRNDLGTSAIDIAVHHNQIRSVNMMIKYIITYQNKYVYAHLFENNLVDLIEKGVEMRGLFNSKIFNHSFDFDEWPTTSAVTETMLEPYNKSIFKLRYEYEVIFKNLYQ